MGNIVKVLWRPSTASVTIGRANLRGQIGQFFSICGMRDRRDDVPCRDGGMPSRGAKHGTGPQGHHSRGGRLRA